MSNMHLLREIQLHFILAQLQYSPISSPPSLLQCSAGSVQSERLYQKDSFRRDRSAV
uniref:Uncharacterized protein n=1 Tax=Anguilla anguilla TaxID=7936 RepID=A0A0E9S2Y0_ANGAN